MRLSLRGAILAGKASCLITGTVPLPLASGPSALLSFLFKISVKPQHDKLAYRKREVSH